MSFRVTLAALAVVMMSVASFGLQFGSNGIAIDLMGNGGLQWDGCDETTCKGPIQVIWNATECRGKPIRMDEILRFGREYDRCTPSWNTSTRIVSTSSTYEEHTYMTNDCTGPKVYATILYYHQCWRIGNNTASSFASVQDFLKFEGALAKNPDGVAMPGPESPLGGHICDPGSCNDTIFQAQWGNGTSCSDTYLSEAGGQWGSQPGVCYFTNTNTGSSYNSRTSCTYSELRADTFIYGCTGTPMRSAVYYMDQQRSNASMAVGYCNSARSTRRFYACRNPTGVPPTSIAPSITLASSLAIIWAILVAVGL